jgi:hypothetical protein
MQPVLPRTEPELDQLCINTIRSLSIDAFQQVKELQRKFGFEPDRIVELAKELTGCFSGPTQIV